METENRTILILFSVVVLLVFLDHQSDRQLKLAGVDSVERLSADELTESALDEAERLDRLHRPALERKVKKSVTRGVEDARDEIEERAEDVSESARLQAEEVADDLTRDATRVVKKGLTQTLDKAKLQLKEVSLDDNGMQAADERLPVLPVIKKDGHVQTQVTLYYPGFQGRKTVMMKVRRTLPESVDAMKALTLLQKGPTPKEKGLVNAFDASLQVKRLTMDGSIAEVYVSESVHRMSAPIRQDRLDQLCLTLLQFREIKGVRIIVDGRVVRQLGTGKDAIPVAQPVRHIDRAIEEYRSL
jgi:spore germination protein GerM